MNDFPPALLWPLMAGVVAVVIVIVVLAERAARRRREALGALAAELGWSFDRRRDTRHDREYAHFEIFRRGHSRAAYNTLEGPLSIDGRPYRGKAGDFTYKVTTGSGKSRSTTTYHFSYLILHLPFPGVPDLLIRRENFFDKLAGMAGFQDINFESAEFSRRFHVRSPDKRFAYDVVHPRMMEFLLACDAPTIDIERSRCCLVRGGRCWSPDEFRATIAWARDFFDLWPDHLTADLETRRA